MSRKRMFFLFALVRRHPALIIVALLLGGAGYGYEVVYGRPTMTYLGIPEAQGWNPLTWNRVFRNEGFMAGYSDVRGNPLWVVYRLAPVAEDAPRFRRPERFSADWRNVTRIDHEDYSRSGYDRGHLAPNYAISRLYGQSAQLDTFRMTNITPQKPQLNQRLWQRLEEVEVDHFTRIWGSVWVFTGPVFDSQIERLNSSQWVEIPDAFYKIFVAPAENGRSEPAVLAFLMPQKVRGDEPLDRYLTTIDKIESLTGLDFLHKLEDSIENHIEAKIDAAPWLLEQVSRRPGRFDKNKRE